MTDADLTCVLFVGMMGLLAASTVALIIAWSLLLARLHQGLSPYIPPSQPPKEAAPMSEVIEERVARVMRETLHGASMGPEGPLVNSLYDVSWDDDGNEVRCVTAYVDGQVDFKLLARAAIEAMREPTQGMIVAADAGWEDAGIVSPKNP